MRAKYINNNRLVVEFEIPIGKIGFIFLEQLKKILKQELSRLTQAAATERFLLRGSVASFSLYYVVIFIRGITPSL